MDYGFILDPGETIIRVVHRHWSDLVAPFAMAIFLTVAAALLAYTTARFPTSMPFPPALVLILVAIITVIAILILLIGLYTYHHNVLVFTNMHIVEVEQNSLFSREVSQLSYNRVQDASGKRVGVWATIFNYGDVTIQSAGEQEKFIFRRAPDPERLADEALQIRDQCLRQMGQSVVNPMTDTLYAPPPAPPQPPVAPTDSTPPTEQ